LKEKLEQYTGQTEQGFLRSYYLQKSQDKDTLNLGQQKSSVEFEKTQLAIVGAVDLLRQSGRFLADQTSPKRNAAEADGGSLDFAQFDCYACHHDLVANSWRQKRGTSGRPQMREWPTVLVRATLHFQGDDQGKFDQAVLTLRRAFDDRPFGDTAKIHSAAADMEKWCTAAAERLAPRIRTIDRPAAEGFLRRLCRLGKEELLDYDYARQTAWAFEIVYGELYPDPKSRPSGIDSLLTELKKEVQLDLPSGANKTVEAELPQNLKERYQYNPEAVQKVFSELANRFTP
jgi:hypothetical protein